jgi:hypothetical protein
MHFTTVSFMLCCTKASPLARWLCRIALLAAVCGVAWAEGITVTSAGLTAQDDTYLLNADFAIQLNPAIKEALNRGVALDFVVQLDLTRPRRFWFDETVAAYQQTRRLAFSALARQYVLTITGREQAYVDLNEAVQALSHVQMARVASVGVMKKEYRYDAALKVKLDVSQLPKPLQMNALASKGWNLSSEPYRWVVTP